MSETVTTTNAAMTETVRTCRDCAKYPNCILRFDEDQRDSCPILKHKEAKLSYRNDEGYPDPTAYQALLHIEQEKKRAARQKARQAVHAGQKARQTEQQKAASQRGMQEAQQPQQHRKDKPKTRPIRPRTQVVHYD